MNKDFDRWNLEKKRINNISENRFYHEREIWWCNIGCNVGSEQDGGGHFFQRPVLILRHLSRQTCLIVPLTRSLSSNQYRMNIGVVCGNLAKVILSQMKVIDTKRLINRMCVLDRSIFEIIRKTTRNMF